MIDTKDIKDTNSIKLGYKPDIKYEDEYDSTYTPQDEDNVTVSLDIHSPQEDISENFDIIDSYLTGIDPSIKDLIEGVFIPIKDLWEEIKDKEYSNVTPQKEIVTIIPDIDKDSDIDEEDDIIGEEEDEDPFVPPPNISLNDNFNDPIHIIEIEHDAVEIIDAEYIKHLYDLLNFYTERLSEYLSNYWIQVGPIISSKTYNDKKYILNNFNSYEKDDFKSVATNKKHMVDFAVRTEITRKQQVSFLQKMFPVDETVIKLRNFKASYELKRKYAKIDNMSANTKVATDHNTLLEVSNIIYNDKYDKSYLALYKYLNSSAKKVNDALTLMVHEAKAKQYLK